MPMVPLMVLVIEVREGQSVSVTVYATLQSRAYGSCNRSEEESISRPKRGKSSRYSMLTEMQRTNTGTNLKMCFLTEVQRTETGTNFKV